MESCRAITANTTSAAATSATAQLDLSEEIPLNSHSLITALHLAGINVRHIGRVAALSRLPHVRDMAVAEMVARVGKMALQVRAALLTNHAAHSR